MHVHHQLKHRTAYMTLCMNLLLVVLKILVGIWSGAFSVISEGVHASTDVVASIVTLTGIKLSIRYHDAERIAAWVETILILGAAVPIWIAAYAAWTHPNRHIETMPGIIILAFSMMVNCYLTYKTHIVARKTHSIALFGNAMHLLTDALADIVTLVGLVIINLTRCFWIDSLLTGVIGALMVGIGCRLLFRLLKNKGPSFDLDPLV